MDLKLKALSLGATNFRKSNKKNKKWKVKYNNRWIDFGDSRYQDYTQHKDKTRQKSYLKRAKGIKDRKGNLTYKNKNTPNYWSIRLLWT
tara:strand:+ start:128 stop:394 length:267 start_codon:yes stop_codon:yes gene_type:complete